MYYDPRQSLQSRLPAGMQWNPASSSGLSEASREISVRRSAAQEWRRRAQRSGMRHGIVEALTHLAGHLAPEAGHLLASKGMGALGFGIGGAGFVAAAVTAIPLGLWTIGHAHREAHEDAKRWAERRGFAEILGAALDNPGHGGAALWALAKGSRLYSNLHGLATGKVPLRPEQRAGFAEVAACYLEGAKQAIHLAGRLTPRDRTQLAAEVARDHDGQSSADRLSSAFLVAR
jgi:hypothetical protein